MINETGRAARRRSRARAHLLPSPDLVLDPQTVERWKERTGSSDLHMCPPHHSHTGITNDRLGNLHGSQYSPEALVRINSWLSLGDTRNSLVTRDLYRSYQQ